MFLIIIRIPLEVFLEDNTDNRNNRNNNNNFSVATVILLSRLYVTS